MGPWLAQWNSAKLGEFWVYHLGPLDAAAVVLMLGRSNVRRRSASIDALLCELHKQGMSVCWCERIGQRNARLRAAWLACVDAAWLDAFASRHPLTGRLITRLIRLCLKIWYPKRRYGLLDKWPLNTDAQEDLRLFLRALPAQQVSIVSHSAGGLLASLSESEPAIQKMICFGYPFRPPGKADEPFRTRHLAAIQKPFLILQGERDEYGSAQDAARYALSPQIVVAALDADHDYDLLGRPGFDRARQLMLDFLVPQREGVGAQPVMQASVGEDGQK